MPRKKKMNKKEACHAEVILLSDEFESGNAEASKTFPIQCSALRKGGHVILKEQPCKIVEMSTSQPGKHGHAKVSKK